MNIAFHGLPTATVRTIRTTMTDAYGQPVETHVSDGDVWPCRHCLGAIPKGTPYLILAHRPFTDQNPYAETGPIFLCAQDCLAHTPSAQLPETLDSAHYILRGYCRAERIVYGTGSVVPRRAIPARAHTLLARPDIAFVDLRSAANNCYQCRIYPN